MSSEFEKIRRCCRKSGHLFEDPDFPCIQSSVFYHETPPFNFTWMRPHEICHDPQFLLLPSINDFPSKIMSLSSSPSSLPNFESILGKLGDPWFISCISTLFQTKGLFYRVVPADQSFHEVDYAGVFHFRIWWFGQWQEVIIDDRLPIVSNNKLAFVQAVNGNIFWPCLLEKAFAKLHGSYEALKYGSSLESLSDVTGGVAELIDLKSDPMSMINTRILMQRLLSITTIVTAVISIDEVNAAPAHLMFAEDLEESDHSPRIMADSRARHAAATGHQQEQFMFGEDIGHHQHHGKNGDRSNHRKSGYKNSHHRHHRHEHDREHSSRHHRASSSLSSSSSDHSPMHSLLHHDNQAFTSSSSNSSSGQHNSSITPFPRLPCGVIGNVNYRITRIERVETIIGENREQIFLLKVINSTGSMRCCYTGPFGRKDDDAWVSISDCDRLRINAIDEEEEEDEDLVYQGDLFMSKSQPRNSSCYSFWIEYSDFMRIFTHLEVVFLDSETSRDEPSLRNTSGCGGSCSSSSRFPMTVKLYRGSWRKGVTAGGCRNNVDSFHQNPQIELTLSLESDDMMIICLNQHSVLEPQVVGFSIYRSSTGSSGGNGAILTSSSSCSSSASSSPLSSSVTPADKSVKQSSTSRKLDRSFFKKNKSLMNSSYSNSRQVLLRCSLDRGSYILIPTTFEPGIESGFTIRVYSMKGIKLRLLDSENSMTKTPLMRSPSSSNTSSFDHKFSECEVMFMQLADEHKSITAHDLHELLDSILPNDYVKSCANIDVARLMVSASSSEPLTGTAGSAIGRMHLKEYKIMMLSLRWWQSVFKNHTKGTTGILRIDKLEDALHEVGYQLSSDVLMALVAKFMRKDSTMRFGDFVSVILHLFVCFTSFTRMHQKQQHHRKAGGKQQQQQGQMMTAQISHLIDHNHSVVIGDGMGHPGAGCSSQCVSLSLNDWLKQSFQT